LKVLFDTNVLFAAFAARGLCESILELCLDQHEIIISKEILIELKKNLLKKLKLPTSTASEITSFLAEHSTLYTPEKVDKDACRDANDLHVLGLSRSSGADYIITGDDDLLVLKSYHNIPIVTPREFSNIIHKQTNR